MSVYHVRAGMSPRVIALKIAVAMEAGEVDYYGHRVYLMKKV